MKELQLYSLLRSVLVENLSSLGYTDSEVLVYNGYAPNITGTTELPAIIFYPFGDHRYGWPRRSSSWDSLEEVMTDVTKQILEATFQITVRADYPLNDPDANTPGDWIELAASILQSDTAIKSFSDQNMGIYRITDIRKPYVTNDRDQNMMAPSFDITLTHVSELRLPGKKLDNIQPGIYPV